MDPALRSVIATSGGRTALARALMAIGTQPNEDGERLVGITVERVLSHVGSERRIAELRNSSAALPPIVVCRYDIGHERFYAVVDGHNRSELARERDRRTIRAKIIGAYRCEPGRFFIDPGADSSLWRFEDDGSAKYAMPIGDPLLRILLTHLGVRDISR